MKGIERFEVLPAGLDKAPPEDCGESFWFWCLGCNTYHSYTTKYAKGQVELNKKAGMGSPTWTFNGNMDSPSFEPSLLYNKDDRPRRCHLYLRNGRIEYLADCFHELKGQTVPLGPLP